MPTVAKFATVQKEGERLDLLDDYDHKTLKKIDGNIDERKIEVSYIKKESK